jgi:hypothetical protein
MSPIGQNVSELETSAYSVLPTCSIPRGNANPWKKVWEKLLQWSDFLTNENQTNWCGRTQSSGARRDQLGAGVREANAKIQFRGDLSRIDRPSDIDRTFIRRLVGFSKAAECPLRPDHGPSDGCFRVEEFDACFDSLHQYSTYFRRNRRGINNELIHGDAFLLVVYSRRYPGGSMVV